MKKLTIATLGLGLWLVAAAADDKPHGQTTAIPAAWIGKVTDVTQLPLEKSDWGTLQ